MGYRELSRMEIVEVVRRWQMGESQRAIARGQWRGARDGEEVPARRRGARVGGQWTATDRGPGGAAGSGGSGRERSADVGIAAGGSAGAVSRADHHLAAG